MSEEIRVRFAPSPTGYLHIGSVRTALFNWLFARHHGGKFVLRIEDTDHARSTEDSIREIMEGLRWLGLDWDEGPDIGGPFGPYRQTERKDIYLSHVETLLQKKKAYRCYCDSETLEKKRKSALSKGEKPKYDGLCRNRDVSPEDKPHVVRFKNPESGSIVVRDLLRGDVTFSNSELDDFIILRTDGSPTYNFVVVIDDVEMRISHVIRGDDHLSNTPRQAQIYDGLGLLTPKFVHIPMIMGSDKTRLSKRHGATSVLTYRDEGYLPEAVVNYLARLGWSCGDEEIFSPEELTEKFGLDNVNTSAAVFNPEKLLWVNLQHIKKTPDRKLASLLAEQIKKQETEAGEVKMERLEKIVPLFKERCRVLSEMANSVKYFIQDFVEYDEKAKNKFLIPENSAIFENLLQSLEGVSDFSEEDTLGKVLRETAEKIGVKLVKIAQPLRVALTGGTQSPGITEVMALLGKETVLSRIREAIKLIRD